jgi:hypothetical protein
VGPEAKLYQKLRKAWPQFSFTRLENLSSLGTPDILASNSHGHFFTIELKVTKGNKLKFSPHQIAFHVKHPHNTFILAEALGPRSLNRFHMYRGSRILELDACGLKLKACCLELEACRLMLSELGAS